MPFHRIFSLMFLCVAAVLIVGVDRVAIAQAPADVGDPVYGRAVAATLCVSCHGADGNDAGPQYPKLAAQDPTYLYWQLWDFKVGVRRSDVMSGVVAALSDADMADAASFFALQSIRPDPVKDKDLAFAGERIYFSGNGAGMVPPCAMCHGSSAQRGMAPLMGGMPMMGRGMMGSMMTAHVPSLSDQHASYIVDQLNRFADGERPGTVMNRVAASLTETDRQAVAAFLSGLP